MEKVEDLGAVLIGGGLAVGGQTPPRHQAFRRMILIHPKNAQRDLRISDVSNEQHGVCSQGVKWRSGSYRCVATGCLLGHG